MGCEVKCPLVLSLGLSSVTGPVVYAQDLTYCCNNHEVDLWHLWFAAADNPLLSSLWKIKCNVSSSPKSKITGIKRHYELFIKNKALMYTRSFLPTLCRPCCSTSELGSICLQIRRKEEILVQSCLIEDLAPSCGQMLETHTWALKTSVSAVETGFPGVASFFPRTFPVTR